MNRASEERVTYLLERIRQEKITPTECDELAALVKEGQDPVVLNQIRTYFERQQIRTPLVNASDSAWQNMLTGILSVDKHDSAFDIPEEAGTVVHGRFRRTWWYAAAAVIILAGASAWFYLQPRQVIEKPAVGQPIAKHTDVAAPAASLATINLANGQQIGLDSAGKGTLTAIGNVQVIKLDDGRIVYQGETDKPMFNTLVNPRGSRVVDITLADGSRVWLNAGSSITYPVAFIGKERNVTMDGEAYFEVAHDAARPFRVAKGEAQVQVLGTRFNVNAYDDEPVMSVTLLEGSVAVKPLEKGDRKYLLKPGQQSQIGKNGEVNLQFHPDLEETMAWKHDKFIFTGNSIQAVMRQLEKWYDVKVEYKGPVSGEEFVGVISRKANVSEILSMLGETHTVSFEIEGKKIVVK
ncbi:FecR family protein [Flavihumibacter petaseus]|uniref:Putative anti-sigma factor n=1 Tax=Flavihumibacter petaseus NBRC 106054 TaxID=1220578 RepID=A0A0E9MUN9_9BACT|nr:FecR domain-containing protein [Flavihumibacter petaseus]GAO41136.1 putative anti-sigma factor [Flavihumibacter petaseus NBRC 106054]